VALETVPTDNGNDGRVEAIIQGGTPPYFVNWLDEMAGEPARNNLSPGEYCVRSVEDARGCRFPDPPGSADPLCALVNDGNIECFAAGRKAITPDGDDLNDEFLINCVESTLSNRLEVFNRWGQLVFEAENYANDWEGTAANGGDLPSGAYYFVFRYDDGSGEEKEARGSLTIVR
jgi:gliding motility-associated-like protein